MKKLLLLILCTFLLASGLFFLLRDEPAKNTAAFLKKVDKLALVAVGSVNTGVVAHRLYLYGDSLFLLSEDQMLISTDTGLRGIRRQPFPFKAGRNSVWYFNKQSDERSFLLYPSGSMLQFTKAGLDSLPQPQPVNNCVNTGGVFWGQTSDAADTRLSITQFDVPQKSARNLFDLYEIFKDVKGFSQDCFSASMDGNFLRINDSSFLFYNYYSSYFLQFDQQQYKLHCGIDSMPLRRFRKVRTTVGEYRIEKCVPGNERFVHLAGCCDGRFVYLLSNISSRELNAQRLADVYDAATLQYQRSFVIPDHKGSKPVDIATGPAGNALYLLYDNNELVKYHKP